MSCRPPLKQLLKCWDAVFAYGVYFATVLAVSECVLYRDDILASAT